MHYNEKLFQQCRNQIEAKLGWGDSTHWTNADFGRLSKEIFSATGVSLSISTLKRLWGKVRYESVPQLATLNALAQFAGYEDFRAYELAHQETNTPDAASVKSTRETHYIKPHLMEAPAQTPSGKFWQKVHRNWAVGILGFSLFLLIAFSLSKKPERGISPPAGGYYFSSHPVSEGIPNSVVFTFDASPAQSDCVFIQQSWDTGKQFKVKKNQKQATSIYYHPGFFKAKLVVDNQVVKEHNLHIKTKGWLTLVEQHPVPVYFSSQESQSDGMLGLTEETLKANTIALQPTVPWACHYYVEDFGALSSENFTLEASVKNTYAKGSGACQHTQVLVLCENTAFIIPLTIPGCTSGIDVLLAGDRLKGQETDLSAFGVKFNDWVKLQLKVQHKHVQISLNGKPVLQSHFSMDAGKITGIVFRFQGTGLVDEVNLRDGKGNLCFNEEF